MKMTEVLARVSKAYLPGAIKFFDQMKPDPWQKAVDQFDAALLTQDQATMEAAGDQYVNRIEGLLKTYKELTSGEPKKEALPVEAFFLGTPKSDQPENSCYACGQVTGLFVELCGERQTETRFTCEKHRQHR